MPTIAFHTLGCKLNFAESSDLLRRFKAEGFSEKSFHEKADVYVINTCSVTAVAEKKCRNAIRQAHNMNPESVIAVIGCFSQVNSKQIEQIPGVNIILGNDDKHLLIDRVKNFTKHNKTENYVIDISDLRTFFPSFSYDDRTRGFLKVQDGCDYFCTYCEIPYARGRSRSCTVNQAVENARLLAKENKKEIVLTGVNIGDFGKGTNENFFQLIQSLDEVKDVFRYRISSIEPNLLTKEIIDFCASSRSFMPHFHIPLQSGSNIVLKNMKRRYLREDFRDKVLYIKSVIPDCFIACDVMTGFNGETPEEFESSYDFLNSLPIAFIHVFTYSERPDAKIDKQKDAVPVAWRRKRSDILQTLALKKKREFYESQINKQVSVLWEETQKDGKMFGFTENYIRCSKDFDKDSINNITGETLRNLSSDKELFEL